MDFNIEINHIFEGVNRRQVSASFKQLKSSSYKKNALKNKNPTDET